LFCIPHQAAFICFVSSHSVVRPIAPQGFSSNSARHGSCFNNLTGWSGYRVEFPLANFQINSNHQAPSRKTNRRRGINEGEASTRTLVLVIRDSGCGNELQQLRFGLGFELYLEIVGWKFLEGSLGEKWPRFHGGPLPVQHHHAEHVWLSSHRLCIGPFAALPPSSNSASALGRKVPAVGIEPTLPKKRDFESRASTNSATPASARSLVPHFPPVKDRKGPKFCFWPPGFTAPRFSTTSMLSPGSACRKIASRDSPSIEPSHSSCPPPRNSYHRAAPQLPSLTRPHEPPFRRKTSRIQL
jgi:hypothetical protein